MESDDDGDAAAMLDGDAAAMLVSEPSNIHEDEHVETTTTAVAKASTKVTKTRAKRLSEDELWGQGTMYMSDVPKEKLRDVFCQLAKDEYGGDGYKLQPWGMAHKKPTQANTAGCLVTKRRCYFHNGEGKCQFVVREVFNVATKTAVITIGSIPHSGHDLVKKSRLGPKSCNKGLPKRIALELFNSPSMLKKKPREILKRAFDLNINPGLKMQKQIRRKHARLREKLIYGKKQTWGAVVNKCESYSKERIPEFNEHSPYLIKFECQPETKFMVAVFSTENLLLNAYRQRFWGFPVFFSADASYRYTKEGMALYPIMTTNIAQQSKIIAYGLVTNEN
jgi:hypothetical protein